MDSANWAKNETRLAAPAMRHHAGRQFKAKRNGVLLAGFGVADGAVKISTPMV
jgi:hypothetical protein